MESNSSEHPPTTSGMANNMYHPNFIVGGSEICSNDLPELVALSSRIRIENDSILTSSDFSEESTTVGSSNDVLTSHTLFTNSQVEYEPQYKDQSRNVVGERSVVVLEPTIYEKAPKENEESQQLASKESSTIVLGDDEGKILLTKNRDVADDDENDFVFLESINSDEADVLANQFIGVASIQTDGVDNIVVVANDSDNFIAVDNRESNLPQVASFHGESLIPMAEAFVIAEDDRDSRQSSEEYHIVQLDEATSSTSSPFHSGNAHSGTASTTTNTSRESHSDSHETSEGTDGAGDRNYDDKRLQKLAIESIQSERKFWMRIILAAVVLNTLLVSGVVVAGFCLSGACNKSSNSSITSSDVNNETSYLKPSLAPTATIIVGDTDNMNLTSNSESVDINSAFSPSPVMVDFTGTSMPTRIIKFKGTAVPTPGFDSIGTSMPTLGFDVEGTRVPTPDFSDLNFPQGSGPDELSDTELGNTTFPPNNENESISNGSSTGRIPVGTKSPVYDDDVSDSVVGGSICANCSSSPPILGDVIPGSSGNDSIISSQPPFFDDSTNGSIISSQPPLFNDSATGSQSGESISSTSKSIIWPLIGAAIGIEIIIIFSLWLQYRKWKQKRDLLKVSQTNGFVSEKHLDI